MEQRYDYSSFCTYQLSLTNQYQEDGSRTSVSSSTVERQTVTSALTINMAMVNDSGEYVCNATSPNYDTVSSEPVLVFVQGIANTFYYTDYKHVNHS